MHRFILLAFLMTGDEYMNTISSRTQKELDTCHWAMKEIHLRAIPNAPYDYGVLQGFRSEDLQNRAFAEGKSDARWGESDHNFMLAGKPCSKGTDIYIWHNGRYLLGDESLEARAMMRETQRYIQGVASGLGHVTSHMPTLKNGVEDLGHISLKQEGGQERVK